MTHILLHATPQGARPAPSLHCRHAAAGFAFQDVWDSTRAFDAEDAISCHYSPLPRPLLIMSSLAPLSPRDYTRLFNCAHARWLLLYGFDAAHARIDAYRWTSRRGFAAAGFQDSSVRQFAAGLIFLFTETPARPATMAASIASLPLDSDDISTAFHWYSPSKMIMRCREIISWRRCRVAPQKWKLLVSLFNLLYFTDIAASPRRRLSTWKYFIAGQYAASAELLGAASAPLTMMTLLASFYRLYGIAVSFSPFPVKFCNVPHLKYYIWIHANRHCYIRSISFIVFEYIV